MSVVAHKYKLDIGVSRCACVRCYAVGKVAHMSTHTVGAVPAFTVADRLRKAREHAGLEQGDLAERMGVSRGTVSNNELGKVAPRRIVLRAWALATGVDVGWLETGIAPRPEPGHDEGLPRLDSNQQPSGYLSLLLSEAA